LPTQALDIPSSDPLPKQVKFRVYYEGRVYSLVVVIDIFNRKHSSSKKKKEKKKKKKKKKERNWF
jgi:hypothetical protein